MISEIASSITLKPSSVYRGLPPAADRAAWDGLPKELRAALIAEGERFLSYSYPQILATDYMEFCRTGNRVHYEDKQFARRTALDALVLAECAEYKGRFLDDIINGIYLICEETGWQLPAHNSYERDQPQQPLPDAARPVIDLFDAETGAVLAVAEYLLRDALAGVSPFISALVNDNLSRRIFTPYLTHHFWWMGDGISPMNNWTSWCTQNVLMAAFTRSRMPDAEQIFKKACLSLDYFLDAYDEDGCCDEGAQYFRHAALTFFESIEILNEITDGAFSEVYKEPKIINMAAYIQNVHVAGPYYLNFADCSPLAGRCGAREYLFGKRTGNRALMAFAAVDYRGCGMRERLTPEEHNLFYRAQSAFCHREIMELAADTGFSADSGPSGAPVPDIFYRSVGLFIARDRHFCLSVKAGGNNDSHNHNDTGSFIVYKDGKPVFIDLGVESYTRKTFSDRRYEIWTMQSAWHNLPTIGGVMQKAGAEYAAADVRCGLDVQATDASPSHFPDTDAAPAQAPATDACACRTSCIRMDIAPAYPDSRILSYVREAALEKERRIVIRDRFRLTEPMPVVLSLITYEKPDFQMQTDGRCILNIGTLSCCRVTGISGISVEEVPVTDPRLALAWKGSIYRILMTVAGTEWEMEIRG